MVIENLKVYDIKKGFVDGKLCVNGDKFCKNPQGDTIDGKGLLAVPGLIDIHFHGCRGVDFCDATEHAIDTITDYEAQNGVCTICPATMTLSKEKIIEICKTAVNYKSSKGSRLAGIYLEGPFLSLAKKGAQNEKYLRTPDLEFFKEIYEASNGLVKIVAIAPEVKGAMEFIEKAKDTVRITIAHSQSDYETANKAFNLGASQVTHLYNAMTPFSHRAPGIVGAALDSPHSMVELITDGVHIHPSVVRATFKMFSDNRIILISDSMMATGLPDGNYSLGGQEVWVKDNCSRLADGTIAGSATNLMNCLRTAVLKMNIPLESAIKCVTVNPAKAIGMFDQIGSLEVGKKADFVLLDDKLNIKHVYIEGIQIPLK